MIKQKWMWVASSNDGCYQRTSSRGFDTKEECYNDMRNAVLEKVKWNTNYHEDFEPNVDDDEQCIGYEILFQRNQITHTSYSGVYTYKIVPYTKKSYPRFLIGGIIESNNQDELDAIEASIQNAINKALEGINKTHQTNFTIESSEHISLD